MQYDKMSSVALPLMLVCTSHCLWSLLPLTIHSQRALQFKIVQCSYHNNQYDTLAYTSKAVTHSSCVVKVESRLHHQWEDH
jgi:hypothetical protein